MDVSVYKAIDPDMNMSIADAKALRAQLTKCGFMVREVFCQPQHDGKGFGIMEDVSFTELIRAGVPEDVPIHLLFRFDDRTEGDNCALVKQFLGDGDVNGVARVYASIHPGDAVGHLFQILRIPAVFNAVNRALGSTAAGI